MKRSDYFFDLPHELIAQHPAPERDESRLMVVHRDSGKIEHRVFSDIVEYLGESDSLVFNNSRVFPARLEGHKSSGGRVEILLLRSSEPGHWEALLKGAKVREGTRLTLPGGGACLIKGRDSSGVASLELELPTEFKVWIERYGKTPLPPYIKRAETTAEDRERYQTVYAKEEGSVAAPTAGLHFTNNLKEKIRENGTQMAYVTLHVGPGTFRPVDCEDIENHAMDPEHFEISPPNQKKLESFIETKKRVIGVGSTSIRTLESAMGSDGILNRTKGSTDLFIHRGYKFKGAGGMITNFHLPESTLFILVSTFADLELMKECYRLAIKERYSFYSFGDGMLIL